MWCACACSFLLRIQSSGGCFPDAAADAAGADAAKTAADAAGADAAKTAADAAADATQDPADAIH